MTKCKSGKYIIHELHLIKYLFLFLRKIFFQGMINIYLSLNKININKYLIKT